MLKRKTIALIAVALGATGVGGAGLAYAGANQAGQAQEAREGPEGNDEQREAAVLAGARISLAQAVQAAEARTQMKATEAGVDDESNRPYFEVSVGQGQQEQTVLVDTQSGQVAQVSADTDQGEEDDD